MNDAAPVIAAGSPAPGIVFEESRVRAIGSHGQNDALGLPERADRSAAQG